MKKHFKVLIVIALVISLATAASFAAAVPSETKIPVTRGELFEALASWLEIESKDQAGHKFPDYNDSNKLINGMVDLKYVLGTSKGTMDENECISLSEVNYLLSRIPKPERIITETKIKTVYSTDTETKYIQVQAPAFQHEDHSCRFDEAVPGKSVCINPNCGKEITHYASHDVNENGICLTCTLLHENDIHTPCLINGKSYCYYCKEELSHLGHNCYPQNENSSFCKGCNAAIKHLSSHTMGENNLCLTCTLLHENEGIHTSFTLNGTPYCTYCGKQIQHFGHSCYPQDEYTSVCRGCGDEIMHQAAHTLNADGVCTECTAEHISTLHDFCYYTQSGNKYCGICGGAVEHEHLFILKHDGLYTCLAEDMNKPVGTTQTPLCTLGWGILSEEKNDIQMQLTPENAAAGTITDVTGNTVYSVTLNCDIIDIDGTELKYIDFFNKYSGKTFTADYEKSRSNKTEGWRIIQLCITAE